jgi:hypothetical protein
MVWQPPPKVGGILQKIRKRTRKYIIMYKYILLIQFFLVFKFLQAQNSQISRTNLDRSIPNYGFNLNALTKTTINNSFVDSIYKMKPALLRYPGGTISQYWDWQNGRVEEDSLWTNGTLFDNFNFTTINAPKFDLQDLFVWKNYLEVEPVYCLNVTSRTIEDQMNMLRAAANLGLPVNYVELGNELYFPTTDFVNAYPTPADYGQEMAVWMDSIKLEFPNVTIAVVGASEAVTSLGGTASPARVQQWNDQLLPYVGNAKAFTFHAYYPVNTSASSPSIVDALAAPFRYNPLDIGYGPDSVSNDFEIWYTEFNITDNAANPVIASSWVHGLQAATIFLLYLDQPQISMMLNHQIGGNAVFGALDSYSYGDTTTNRLTPLGNAMRLLFKSMGGRLSATKLDFTNNPSLIGNGATYPALIGWEFALNQSSKNLLLMNLSGQDITLELSEVLTGTYSYEMIRAAQPLQTAVHTGNLLLSNGLQSDTTFVIPAYSMLRMQGGFTPSAIAGNPMDIDFQLYPNPTSKEIQLKYKLVHSEEVNLQVFDILGRELKEMNLGYCPAGQHQLNWDLSDLAKGSYILVLNTEKQSFQKVFVKID